MQNDAPAGLLSSSKRCKLSNNNCFPGLNAVHFPYYVFEKTYRDRRLRVSFLFVCLLLQKSFYSTIAHPRPHVAELGPDNRVNRVFVTKPVLSAAIYDTTFNTLEDVPTKQCNGVC